MDAPTFSSNTPLFLLTKGAIFAHDGPAFGPLERLAGTHQPRTRTMTLQQRAAVSYEPRRNGVFYNTAAERPSQPWRQKQKEQPYETVAPRDLVEDLRRLSLEWR
jgi:hypothetical protein